MSTNQATSSSNSPPFDQSQAQNSYFHHRDARYAATPDLNPGFHLYNHHQQQQHHHQQQQQHMGAPLYSMSNFSNLNNLDLFSQHSSSYSVPYSTAAAPEGTINPQLISSPPLDSNPSWNPSFGSNSIHSPFLRPGRPLVEASPSAARIPASVESYASSYTSLDPPFDHIIRPTHATSTRSQSTSSLRVFKTEPEPPSFDFSEGQSNDTSLHPGSSSSLLSGSRSAKASDNKSAAAAAAASQKSKSSRQPPPRRAANKRRRPSDEEELSEEEENSDEEEGLRSNGAKFHKACSNCRRQKGKCFKRDADEKCRMCRQRNLPCVFERRPERKQPVQRKVLLEQLKQKDAIIESFRKMLKPHMLQFTGESDRNPSSGSPSSAAHEEPLRKQVLDWLEKAEASKISTGAFNLDSRAFNDSSSDDNEDGAAVAGAGGIDRFSASAASSSLSRPKPQHHHSYGYSSSGFSANQVDISGGAERNTRSKSPRVTRNSIAMNHPVGLLARASLRGSGMGSRPSSIGEPINSPTSPAEVGVARHDYFVSGDSLAQRASQLGLRRIEVDSGLSEEPKLLRKGLIVPDEVNKLFEIFYQKLNPSVSLLDPVLHTPERTFARCPLLFTVVCAVASRYYTERPELYSIAMHFAMTSAASSLMESKKSVELCQAYLLLSVWSLPSRKYDEDRAWLYLGLAIRMAMDLNLHLPTNIDPVSEQQEREILNRMRTWIVCFNMDRSSSAQLGKPMTIRENYMIRTSEDWYKRSKFNHPYDLHLCQLTALMRIMSRFQETVYADVNNTSGVKEDLDLRITAFEFDNEIVQWEKGAAELFARESDPNDPGCLYRCHLLPFYVNYSRLVILSFGFQYSFRMGLLLPNDDLVTRCIEAAQNVISTMVNDLAARPYLRYAPDGHLVFASFASAFLLKLLRQKFSYLLSEDRRAAIIPLVDRLIRVLSDPSVAVEEFHTPKIYARFLAGLLHKHRMQAKSQPTGHDQDTEMHMHGHQNMGLTIDLNMIHNGVAPGPLSPPSPHPSIQVTPPPTDLAFSFLLHDSIDTDDSAAAEDSGAELPLESSAAPSGSGTVHPLDEMARQQEDDDDLLAPLRAINNPGFWNHGMVPWPELSMPAGPWDNQQSFISNFDA